MGNNSKRNKVALRFLCIALQVIARNMHTKYGPFEPIVTKLCSGQELFLMLYKNQRGIIQKWKKEEVRFLCTALQVIARNMYQN